MNKEELITEVLCLPSTAIEYAISERLAKLFPEKALIEGYNNGYFDVETYAEAGHCVLAAKTFLHNQKMTYWMQPEAEVVRWHRGHMHVVIPGMAMGQVPTAGSKDEEKTIGSRYKKAWLEMEWQESSFDLLLMQFDDGDYHKSMFWLLAESEEVARNFLDAVCRWNMELRGEVLMFDNGHWYKNYPTNLLQDTQ